jgi:hypothetical protein
VTKLFTPTRMPIGLKRTRGLKGGVVGGRKKHFIEASLRTLVEVI